MAGRWDRSTRLLGRATEMAMAFVYVEFQSSSRQARQNGGSNESRVRVFGCNEVSNCSGVKPKQARCRSEAQPEARLCSPNGLPVSRPPPPQPTT